LNTAAIILKKNWRLIAFIGGIIIVFWLLYALRSAILPFILGLVLAYLLLPVISWIEKKLPHRSRWLLTKRVTLIVLFLLVILALIGLFVYFIFVSVIDALAILINNAPQYIAGALITVARWAEGFGEQFPAEIRAQIDQIILDTGEAAGGAIRGLFTRGITFIPQTVSLALGFGALPIFLFYILKDSKKLSEGFYSAMPVWVAEHARNIVSIIETVLGRYIRAQIMLAFIVGYLCFIGLLVLKIEFALALAAFAGVTELIPILGPWLGGITAVVVTLAIVPEKAIWVAILFLLVQLLENNLLVPRIQGGILHINPAILIVLLVLGAYIAGFWGIVLAAPLTATVVEIYKYVRRNLVTDELQQSIQSLTNPQE